MNYIEIAHSPEAETTVSGPKPRLIAYTDIPNNGQILRIAFRLLFCWFSLRPKVRIALWGTGIQIRTPDDSTAEHVCK